MLETRQNDTTRIAEAPMSPMWRQRSFLALWSAHTVSQFGTQITLFVIPVLALATLSATPGQLGLVSAAETVPFLLVGLPAGALLDRWDRRRVMVVADLGRAVAICVLPLGYALDALSVPLLCAVAFVTGVFTVFFDIADQSLLPSVVSRAQTADGNSRLEISRSTAELAGPSLGGLLLQLLAAPLILLGDAASYLLSALLLCSVRTRHDDDLDRDLDREHGRDDGYEHGHTERRAAPESRMRTRIAEGLRFVLTHRTLRPLALATAIGNLASLGGALSALLTAYAVHDLGLSPGALGLGLSLGNAGALLGAVATGRLIRRFGLGPVLIVAKSLPGLAVLILATAAPGRASATVAFATGILACGVTVYNIGQVSLRQAVTPTALQARMNASVRFVIWGTLPLGALAGGLLGSWLGLRPALWLVGATGLLSCLPLLLAREVRVLRAMPTGPGSVD
ncbi:MFS transporter [Kitasatospora sp. NPDC056531]|uniref:MFS transporter n=1 Tax=Kitasatospora sp. NPDC056531 TaxID=3345856 RepID=UPI003682D83C